MKTNKTRRNFMITSSKILISGFGLSIFGRYFSFSQTVSNHKNIDSFTCSNIRKEKDNTHYLVSYESKFGSTKEVAQAIAKTLSKEGKTVTVKGIKKVKNLAAYSHVVIGSAIQYDKWMPEARAFIIKNEKALSKMTVDYFLVCLVLSKKSEKAKQKADGYALKIKHLAPTVKVNNFGKFAGVLDYSKMSFGQRLLAKGIFAIIGVKEGDYRNWKAIDSWAKNIVE